MKTRSEKIMLLLMFIGLILSSYLTYLHYEPEKLNTDFCDINSYLSCSTVNQSTYASFIGIPVALFGILGFLLLLIIMIKKPKNYEAYTLIFILIALLFMIYLTLMEIFMIKALCIYCISVALTVLLLFIIALINYKTELVRFIKEIKVE